MLTKLYKNPHNKSKSWILSITTCICVTFESVSVRTERHQYYNSSSLLKTLTFKNMKLLNTNYRICFCIVFGF